MATSPLLGLPIPEPETYVTPEYLEARLSGITIPQLPSDLITEQELETRIGQINIPTIPNNLATTSYVETRISSLPTSDVTQEDIELAATAVDAKFDMLRSAIAESTSYATLKARLLAVLE